MKKIIVGLIALGAVATASAATTNFLLLPPASPAGHSRSTGTSRS